MAKKKSGTIFDKVLFIGPDVNNRGGIVAVLRAYRDNFRHSIVLAPTAVKVLSPELSTLYGQSLPCRLSAFSHHTLYLMSTAQDTNLGGVNV